jgi:hypothetical protein
MSLIIRRSPEANFLIDLMMVRDGDRVVSILDASGTHIVPDVGSIVTAQDEDGYTYDARVETVLPDRRVYLRIAWPSRRRAIDVTGGHAITFRPLD